MMCGVRYDRNIEVLDSGRSHPKDDSFKACQTGRKEELK